MRRSIPGVLSILLVVMLTSVKAEAGDKYLALPIGKSLYGEVLHQRFVTKVALGNMTQTNGMNGDVGRLVDSEFSPDGTVKYFVRRGFSNGTGLFLPGKYIEASAITSMFGAGTEVSVTLVEFFPDRIELHLLRSGFSEQQEGGYAKIKLMLGKGYETGPSGKILELLDTVLPVPSVENRINLENQYRTLTEKIRSDTRPHELDPRAIYRNMSRLADDYGAIAGVVSDLRQADDSLVASDQTDYQALRADALGKLPALQVGVDEYNKHQAELRNQAQVGVLKARCSGFESSAGQELYLLSQTKATTDAAMTQRQADLDRLDLNVKAWRDAESALNDQHAGSAEMDKEVSAAEATLKHLHAELDTTRTRVKEGAIDTRYRSLTAKRTQLTATYTAAFGSPQAGSAKAALRDCLQQIYVNRMEALSAGSHVAQQQANEAQEAMRRLQ